jgi:hypothetical protein
MTESAGGRCSRSCRRRGGGVGICRAGVGIQGVSCEFRGVSSVGKETNEVFGNAVKSCRDDADAVWYVDDLDDDVDMDCEDAKVSCGGDGKG